MFWQTFLNLCNSVGKSPTAVVREIGMTSSGTVSSWRKGAIPRSAALARLSEYFGVSTEYLLTGKDSNKKETPTVSDERVVNDADIMAAFWGGDGDLTGEDVAELWADAKEYIAFKTAQLKKRKQHDGR